MTEHVVITDPDLHEPKGISTALDQKVYVADGLGSGDWDKIYLHGVEIYGDTGSTQNLSSGAWIDITNDGAVGTDVSQKLPGRGNIWDTSNDQFDWSAAGLVIGDTVEIRLDLQVTNDSANDLVRFGLDMAHGDPSEYRLILADKTLKTVATHELKLMFNIAITDSDTRDNPAKLIGFSDSASDSLVVDGFYIKVCPKNPVFA